MNKAIVFGADNAYLDKVTTTIKSVCSHNSHVTFYILNDDIPSEWFRIMNHRLKVIQSKIVNIKITEHPLKNYKTPDANRLNYAAFFRYYIPRYVKEARALYLDSDIIVTANLDQLFSTDLEGKPLAAVQDASSWEMLTTFNSGVMLIDTKKWRQDHILEQLIDLTNQHHEHTYGDQGVLNMYFQDNWKALDKTYNYMVGLDSIIHSIPDANHDWYQHTPSELPKIIHYTAGKPWQSMNQNRFKDVWWFYHSLDWSDILLGSYALQGSYWNSIDDEPFHTAIFTNVAEMAHLEYLIQSLPQVHFHILAPTTFASSVMDLQTYLNVSLYPAFNPFSAQSVLEKIDFYLDINYYHEVGGIMEKVQKLRKPILSFNTTNHLLDGDSVIFDEAQPEQMIAYIREITS